MRLMKRTFLKRIRSVAALCLSLACTCISAQWSGDALYIDKQGRVGINNQSPGAALDVAGEVRGVGMVPPGGIVMFSGDAAKAFDRNGTGKTGTPYEGWQLCNGRNKSPDLRNRFVVGTGDKYKLGSTGGADAVTLSAAQMPSHNHSASTNKTGNHVHKIQRNRRGELRYTWKNGDSTSTVKAGAGGKEFDKGAGLSTDSRGSHNHSVSVDSTGGNQSHENRPAYYALAFIMRLP